MKSGSEIVIEERSADELRSVSNAPADIPTYNPAFDVTPADLLTGIVTERGTIYKGEDGSFNIKKFVETGGVEGVGIKPTVVSGILTEATTVSHVERRMGGVCVGEVTEIHGGNLNYAFCVKTEGKSFFVKQAPDFIKCLGPDAKLHSDRLLLEVRTYEEWVKLTSDSVKECLPKIFDVDADSCTVIMEFLEDCDLFEHTLVKAPIAITPVISEVRCLHIIYIFTYFFFLARDF